MAAAISAGLCTDSPSISANIDGGDIFSPETTSPVNSPAPPSVIWAPISDNAATDFPAVFDTGPNNLPAIPIETASKTAIGIAFLLALVLTSDINLGLRKAARTWSLSVKSIPASRKLSVILPPASREYEPSPITAEAPFTPVNRDASAAPPR